MSRSAAALSIRPEAVNAWLALSDALNRMTDDGRTPVCVTHPEHWTSDPPDYERIAAAEACTYCPAMAACRAFAEANREPQGVFGGRDFTPIPKTRKKAA